MTFRTVKVTDLFIKIEKKKKLNKYVLERNSLLDENKHIHRYTKYKYVYI